MRRGFTLVELMVLIVIAGLILGVGVPAFLDFRESLDERQAPNQVRTDLETARQSAIERHVPVIVSFGRLPSASYAIHTDTNGNGLRDAGEPWRTCPLPGGAMFTRVTLSPADTLWFGPDGALRAGGRGGVVVIRGQRFADTLVVSSAGSVVAP
jgi:type IV fimbrial biogenesis protein FimT